MQHVVQLDDLVVLKQKSLTISRNGDPMEPRSHLHLLEYTDLLDELSRKSIALKLDKFDRHCIVRRNMLSLATVSESVLSSIEEEDSADLVDLAVGTGTELLDELVVGCWHIQL